MSSRSPNARRGFVEDGAARAGEAVLGEVADRERGRLDDGSGVGLFEACHHAEQGGLARAVRAAEADPFTVGDLPGDVVEENPVAEGLGQCDSWIMQTEALSVRAP